ncbi:MAG: GTP-binding protein [bacterium]|nr:GTP-binding protein [bacterium]
MVKINIISGFLGAGKTTLIKKLLAALEGEKVILLENEYGEVGVDGSFLKDSGIVVDELSSGCICCTLAGDFQKAVDELIEKYHPDRILVEPTGVGKLSEIIAAVEKCRAQHDDIEIGGSATVVDAGKCRMYMKNFGEFFLDQVQHASTVIFSRTQLLSADRVEKSRALIAQEHPDARIITTPWDELDAAMMLRVIEEGKPIEVALVHEDDDDEDGHEHHHHDHDGHDDDEHEYCHHHHHDDDDDDDDDEHHHHHDHEEHHVDEHGHCSCGHDHHHHHHHGHDADEVFQNIGVETARRYEQDEIRAMVDKLGDEEEFGQVLRAKGILQNAAGEWFQFDYVPGELQMRPGAADYTGRLCVIGVHLEEKALKELFKV